MPPRNMPPRNMPPRDPGFLLERKVLQFARELVESRDGFIFRFRALYVPPERPRRQIFDNKIIARDIGSEKLTKIKTTRKI